MKSKFYERTQPTTFAYINSLGARASSSWIEAELLDMPIPPTPILIERYIASDLVEAAEDRIDPAFLQELLRTKERLTDESERRITHLTLNPQFLSKLIYAAMPVLFPDEAK